MADNNEEIVRIDADVSGIYDAMRNARAQLEELQRTARATGNVVGHAFDSADDAINENTRAMSDFEDVCDNVSHVLDDFDMNKMQKEIEKTRGQLDKLLARQDRMRATGVNAASNAFKNLQYDIESARNRLSDLDRDFQSGLSAGIEELQQRMESIADTEVPSEQYTQLASEADKAKDALDQLYAKQEQMRQEHDVSNTPKYRQLQANIDDTAAHLQELQNKLASFSDTDMYSPEVARYIAQIDQLNERIEHLTASQEQLETTHPGIAEDTERWSTLSAQIEEVQSRIADLRNQRVATMQSGYDQNIEQIRGIENAIYDARDEYTQLENEISQIELGSNGEVVGAFQEIQRNIEAATQQMDNFAGQIDLARSIGTAYSAAYNDVRDSIQAAETELADMRQQQEAMRAAGVDESGAAWTRLRQRIADAEASVQDYNRRLEEMRASGEDVTPGTSTEDYRSAQDQLSEYEQALQDAQATNADYINRAQTGYSNLFARINRGASTVGKNIFKSIGHSLTSSFQTAGKFIGNVIGKLKQLGKQSNNVDNIVKKMTKSLTSIFASVRSKLSNLAVSSIFEDAKSTFSGFAKTSDAFNAAVSSMIDSTRALGAQIVAIVEPVVSTIGPMLSSLVDKLTWAADAVAQFVARITDNQEYMKAVKGNSDYAQSLDNAEKSAKKAKKATDAYKNSVLSFDELHKLDAQDTAVGIDTPSMEKAATEATKLNKIADALNTAFKKGDFYGIGSIIAGVVNDAFAWLDDVAGWSKNEKKFTKIFKNIVSAINGFIDSLNGLDIGKTIGDIVNTIIEGFAILVDPQEGIDFDMLGRKIGDALLAMITEIHWDTLGRGLMNALQGGITMINGILTDTITDEAGNDVSLGTAIGNALSDLFEGAIDAIDPEAWGNVISNMLNNVIDLIVAFLDDTSNIQKLTSKFAEAINVAVSNISADTLASAISALSGTLVTAFETLVTQIDWGSIWDKLIESLSSQNFDWLSVIEAIGIVALPGLIVKTITTGLSGLGSTIASSAAAIAADPVVLTAVAAAFGISGGVYGVTQVVNALPTMVQQTQDLFTGDNDYSLKALDDLDTQFENFGGAFGAALATKYNWTDIVLDKTGAWSAFDGVILRTQELVDDILGSNGMAKIGDHTVMITDKMRDMAQKLIDQGYAIDTSSKQINDTFDPAISDVSTSLDNASTSINDFASTSIDNASASLDNFGASLDAMSDRMDNYANDYISSIIKTDYGDGGRSYNLPHYARGGLVGDGQLFVANEGGAAELIMPDAQGNTAVVNNNQIISAIVTGVKQAVTEAGVSIADRVSSQQGQGGDIVLVADNVELARSVTKGQRQIDRRSNHNIAFA